ncbi:MAG: hypothetical protein MUD12_15875 [Spirochaetes bacterium]|nr:hypothetical protein [Spirochaetota bacterium]
MLKRLVKYVINGGVFGVLLAHSDWFMYFWRDYESAVWWLINGGRPC